MSRIVVVAGGSPHAHDFVATGAELAVLADAAGHQVELVTSPAAAADALCDPLAGPVDALVFDGLWWRMEGANYDRWRDEHGYSPSPAVRSALAGYVSDGGGLLALHTAPICFDDWPEWRAVVGGAWQWGVSTHPAPQPSEVRIVAEHPVVAGLTDFTITDEIYGDMAVDPSVEVLAVARRHDGDTEQPIVWTHRYGSGRVVYDALGHDVASLRDPAHTQLLGQALAWILERPR